MVIKLVHRNSLNLHLMAKRPLAVSSDEMKEIASLKEIQALWQAESSEVMERILKGLYSIKFVFSDGTTSKDLFIVIQSNFLHVNVPVVRLIRNAKGQLKVVR